MTEKKSLWRLVPDSTIISVELNLRKPSPTSIQEVHQEVEVFEPKLLFEKYENDFEPRSLYLHSRVGYAKFKQFVFGKMFGRTIPMLEFNDLDPLEALKPIMPGLEDNNRVIVKSAKSIKYCIHAGYDKIGRSGLVEVNIELQRPTGYVFARDYDFNPYPHKMIPCRIPIVLSGEREGVDRFAGLTFEVLCHQLEPMTTRRINQRMLQENLKRDDDLEKLVAVGLYEEAVVATGITRYWLSSTQEASFNESEIATFNPYELHQDDSENSLLQLQRVGVERVIDFYDSKRWYLMDYLNGTFK